MQQQKQQFRELIAKRISAISEKDAAAESRSVCRRISEELGRSVGAQHAAPLQRPAICAFYTIRNEVDIVPLLQELLDDGYALYLPRMENNKTVYRRVADLSDVKPGTYNIPEPPADAPALPPDGPVIALIPGRAFDRKGNRLGRGNGGYDHWIAGQRKTNPEMQFWGVCYECQLVAEIPLEPHDEKVDGVITARGLQKSE